VMDMEVHISGLGAALLRALSELHAFDNSEECNGFQDLPDNRRNVTLAFRVLFGDRYHLSLLVQEYSR
jgi:hypothetical protein